MQAGWQKQSTSSSFQELTHLFGHLSKFSSSLLPARGFLTTLFPASLLFLLQIPWSGVRLTLHKLDIACKKLQKMTVTRGK